MVVSQAWNLQDQTIMNRVIVAFFVLAFSHAALAKPTLETVLRMLRAHSVAANSGDVAEIVLSVPEKGMSLVQPNGETTVIDRPMMEKHLRTFFERTQPDTYVYGIRIRSVNGEDEDSITLTLEISESYMPAEGGRPVTSWFRERITVGSENGKTVVLKAVMETPQKGPPVPEGGPVRERQNE